MFDKIRTCQVPKPKVGILTPLDNSMNLDMILMDSDSGFCYRGFSWSKMLKSQSLKKGSEIKRARLENTRTQNGRMKQF